MTDKENITAILECYFSGFNKERIDSACNRILELKHHINVDVLVPKKQELSQAIFDKGYEQGYKDGQAQQIASDDVLRESCEQSAYEKGLNDAWECAKKIVEDVVDPNFESGYMVDIFGCESVITAMKNNSPSEAIDKIKEYKENEIKVGDEVVDGEVFNSGKGIVTFVSPAVIYLLWYDGSTGRRKLEDVKKTGRHFDQITWIMKQLKEEEK